MFRVLSSNYPGADLKLGENYKLKEFFFLEFFLLVSNFHQLAPFSITNQMLVILMFLPCSGFNSTFVPNVASFKFKSALFMNPKIEGLSTKLFYFIFN